ncbi:MAG: DUF488 domain-containing protein [Ignavibacteria bacterium]|nr:DUF488 domain-containing protein [Ignavibacteria bacterium]
MYYRRKILLALLEAFESKLEKISIQKLLLLVTKQQSVPSYHFVPYKYGCYSFQSNADLSTMVKYNQVSNEGIYWIKTDKVKYLQTLKECDRKIISSIKRQFENAGKNELIKYTYKNFPYYALHSTIAKEILSTEEYKKVIALKPESNETIIFTIGYEGISLEEYLNKLIINDVKVLCDVRKNALSMKFGFSKSQLQKACEGVGIKYVHIPELGIDSDKRQVLNTQADYDKLFAEYRKDVLAVKVELQEELLQMLRMNERIALTCFEADIFQCHRKHLADSLKKLPDFDYQIKHI